MSRWENAQRRTFSRLPGGHFPIQNFAFPGREFNREEEFHTSDSEGERRLLIQQCVPNQAWGVDHSFPGRYVHGNWIQGVDHWKESVVPRDHNIWNFHTGRWYLPFHNSRRIFLSRGTPTWTREMYQQFLSTTRESTERDLVCRIDHANKFPSNSTKSNPWFETISAWYGSLCRKSRMILYLFLQKKHTKMQNTTISLNKKKHSHLKLSSGFHQNRSNYCWGQKCVQLKTGHLHGPPPVVERDPLERRPVEWLTTFFKWTSTMIVTPNPSSTTMWRRDKSFVFCLLCLLLWFFVCSLLCVFSFFFLCVFCCIVGCCVYYLNWPSLCVWFVYVMWKEKLMLEEARQQEGCWSSYQL